MAVRTDFTAGEVLTAQDLDDTFASKVDYALPVNAQTGTTYTFVLADAEKLTTASNAAAVTLTIPPQSSVTWADNTVLRVVNYGAGAVTVDGGSGVTVTNTASTIAQYGAAVAIRTGSDAWTLVPFGGGDVPAAEVSSPAATGQYTDTGITYDYYTFTASGTLTVDTDGIADILVIAGGGGGGSGNNNLFYGGGGGAGGYIAETVYLNASTTYTVTVGAGGAGGRHGTDGNVSGLGPAFVALGGGGGGGSYGYDGNSGGSAGGAGGDASGGGGVGGTSSYSLQGNDGGDKFSYYQGGGGGGAGEAGNTDGNGQGGDGLSSSITGSAVTRAGGGGGGGRYGGAIGGDGGGGDMSIDGTANTGGGGGGDIYSGGSSNTPGNGGSGVVIVRVAV